MTTLSLGLASCSSCSSSQSAEATDSTLQMAPIALDSIIVNDTLYAKELSRSGAEVAVWLAFRFPKEDSTLQRLFVRGFFGDEFQYDAPKEAMRRYLEAVRSEYLLPDEEREMIPYDETEREHSDVQMTNNVIYADSLIIAVSKELYTYSAGAAHGLEGVSYMNIDRRNKQLISEGDLFVEGYAPMLSKILQRCLLRDYNSKSAEDLLNQTGIDASEMSPNDNFTLERDGLVYAFNPYEIAPYAVGIVKVHVPYEELQGLLRPASLLAAYLPTK